VLLLPGFSDSWRLWRHQLPALAKAGHRVIAPDLRGFGKTDRPAEVVDYKLRALVNDVVWYRANNDPATFVINDPTRISVPPVACPTLGVWSSDDFALTEAQMTGSGRFVSGPGATSGWTAWTTGCPCTPPNASMSCSSISSAWLSARPGAVGAGRRRGGGGLDDVGSRVDDGRDLDIAADRVRIGTYSVRLGNHLLSVVVIQFWQAGVEFDGEPVPARPVGADADPGGDGGTVGRKLHPAGSKTHRVLEARGVAGGEQLLRVGGWAAWSAQLLRDGEVRHEGAIGGSNTAFSSSVRCCLRGVENLHRAS
jgi:alpha/beta hydrolase fold